GALDPARHEMRVRRLAVRRTELAREVCGRHERRTRQGGHVEGLRVCAVHEVPRPAQVHEIGALFGRHTTTVRDQWVDGGVTARRGTWRTTVGAPWARR